MSQRNSFPSTTPRLWIQKILNRKHIVWELYVACILIALLWIYVDDWRVNTLYQQSERCDPVAPANAQSGCREDIPVTFSRQWVTIEALEGLQTYRTSSTYTSRYLSTLNVALILPDGTMTTVRTIGYPDIDSGAIAYFIQANDEELSSEAAAFSAEQWHGKIVAIRAFDHTLQTENHPQNFSYRRYSTLLTAALYILLGVLIWSIFKFITR